MAGNSQPRALAIVSLLLLQASCLPWLDNATPGWFEPPLPWLMRAGGAWGVAAACCLLYSGAPQWQRTGVDLLRVVGVVALCCMLILCFSAISSDGRLGSPPSCYSSAAAAAGAGLPDAVPVPPLCGAFPTRLSAWSFALLLVSLAALLSLSLSLAWPGAPLAAAPLHGGARPSDYRLDDDGGWGPEGAPLFSRRGRRSSMRSSPGGKPRAKLARGWREHEDADGCPYYRHRKTGQVQWRPPIDCHLGALESGAITEIAPSEQDGGGGVRVSSGSDSEPGFFSS